MKSTAGLVLGLVAEEGGVGDAGDRSPKREHSPFVELSSDIVGEGRARDKQIVVNRSESPPYCAVLLTNAHRATRRARDALNTLPPPPKLCRAFVAFKGGGLKVNPGGRALDTHPSPSAFIRGSRNVAHKGTLADAKATGVLEREDGSSPKALLSHGDGRIVEEATGLDMD